MIRKQIYLDEKMIEQIKELADKKTISQSEVIRQSLADYIRKEQLKGEVSDPLLELIGLVDIPLEDGSENHDIDIYGINKHE